MTSRPPAINPLPDPTRWGDATAHRNSSRCGLTTDSSFRVILPDVEGLGVWRCSAEARITHTEGALFARGAIAGVACVDALLWALPGAELSAAALARLRKAVSANEPFSELPMSVTSHQGQSFKLLMSGHPISDHAGKSAGYEGSLHDVTRQHQTNEANHQLAHALRHPDSAFAIFDANGILRSHTHQWVEVQGRCVREFVTPGIHFDELLERELATFPFRIFDTRRRAAWKRQRLKYFEAANGKPLEFGSGRNRRHSIRCLRLNDGGILMSIDDISLADGVQRSESEGERFRSYLASSGEWFWEVDEYLRLNHISERFTKDFRLRASEVLGHRLVGMVAQWATVPEEVAVVTRSLESRTAFEGLEISLRDRSAQIRYMSVSGIPFKDSQGNFAGFRGIGRDVTQARRMQERLAHRSMHDELTGLFNRHGLQQRLEKLLATSDRHGPGVAICYVDVDQFQVINDTCGYAAGDSLLQRIAAVLVMEASEREQVARVGGDEFVVLLPERTRDEANSIAVRICETLRDQVFTWDEQPFHITGSIGVAHNSTLPQSATEMLRAADSACYAAKDTGRDRVKLFSSDDSTLNLRHGRMHWIARINSALQEDRLILFVQPIASSFVEITNRPHYEVLLRLQLRDGRIASPAEFLPAAEQYNLVTAIDRWVVEHCIRVLQQQPDFLRRLGTLSVNLSGRSIGDQSFSRWCMERIGSHPNLARKLCFEVTETAMMGKLALGQQFITRMRSLGCSFALDDFGSGLSSFAYLKDLQVDYLKIDGQFVRNVDKDPVHLAMVRSINEVAHVMGKKTIAEVVESDAVRQTLAGVGVDLVQGYAIGRPVPIGDVLCLRS